MEAAATWISGKVPCQSTRGDYRMIAGWIFPCPNHRGASGGTQGGAEPVVDNEKKCDGPSLGTEG